MSNSAYRAYWPHGIPLRRRPTVQRATAAAPPVATGTGTEKRRFRAPPKFQARPEELIRKVVLPIVNDLQRGKANNTYELTLAVAPATSTVLETEIATEASEALLTPKSASAAASLLDVYTECLNGSVVIYHDANVADDRTFGIVLCG